MSSSVKVAGFVCGKSSAGLTANLMRISRGADEHAIDQHQKKLDASAEAPCSACDGARAGGGKTTTLGRSDRFIKALHGRPDTSASGSAPPTVGFASLTVPPAHPSSWVAIPLVAPSRQSSAALSRPDGCWPSIAWRKLSNKLLETVA